MGGGICIELVLHKERSLDAKNCATVLALAPPSGAV